MSIEPRMEIAEILAGGFLRMKKDDITAPKITEEFPENRLDVMGDQSVHVRNG